MKNVLHTETQRMLAVRIQELKEIIEAAELELEQTEKALDATLEITKERDIKYPWDSNFRQKIYYCLNKRKRILSIKEMVAMLTEVDSTLKENEANTAKSLRVQVRRMLKEDMIVEYKFWGGKNIHYALKHWTTDGKVKEQFLP